MADQTAPSRSIFAVWRWPSTSQGRRYIVSFAALLIPFVAVTMYCVAYAAFVTTAYSMTVERGVQMVYRPRPDYWCNRYLSRAWKPSVFSFFSVAHHFDKILRPNKWFPQAQDIDLSSGAGTQEFTFHVDGDPRKPVSIKLHK